MTAARRILPLVVVVTLVAAACSGDDDTGEPAGADAAPTTDAPRERLPLDDAVAADFEAHGSVEQVYLTGVPPATELQLVDADDGVVATATADAQGGLIFRSVPAGEGYRVAREDGGTYAVSKPVAVTAPDDHPDAAFYEAQTIEEGYQYLETRDGTLLAINVQLPGPMEDGPYPTVVEYSGYSPANPDSPQPSTLITSNLSFATVGVNMRGTGCSGGAFEFFETLQSTDGYDVVETIAAQSWVEHNHVGMVGVSYPGISQLFVAATQPPHLAAIAPLSVIADTGRGTLRPGGILNNGFATNWAEERKREAEPAPESGQGWARTRIEDGDETCVQNQLLRLQAPDIIQMIDDNPYWVDEIAAPLAPELFVDRIEVPVFLAGAWQDEQTGGYFANMLDDFTGTDKAWFTITNGGHTDSLAPAIFDRWLQFLLLYVAEDVPTRPPTTPVVYTVLASTVYGVAAELPPDRFASATSYDDARREFESDPRVRILLENGGGEQPGWPLARGEATFDAWPPPADARAFAFGADGMLHDDPPEDAAEVSYRYDPARAQTTTLVGDDSGPWVALPAWDWQRAADGTAAQFETDALDDDLVLIGNGSVDLWLQSTLDDVDLQVTVSEVRPDSNEVFVQNGWLRASHRALHDDATELRPLHSHREDDAAPLVSGEWNEARVELFPFAHVFRAGSRLRVVVEAPGGTRPEWKWDALPAEGDAEVRIGIGGDRASRVVLPVVDGVDVPAGLPACPGLRAQPCRPTT